MSPHPQPLTVDPELGPMRYCRGCSEWWPDDPEFWYSETRRPQWKRCIACKADPRQHANRKRERGLCIVGECPVSTPRERCYWHQRDYCAAPGCAVLTQRERCSTHAAAS